MSRRGAAFGAMLAAFDTGIGSGSATMGGLIHHFGFRLAFGAAAGLAALSLPDFLFAERSWATGDLRRPLSFLLLGLFRTLARELAPTATGDAADSLPARLGWDPPFRTRPWPIAGSPNGIGISGSRHVHRQRAR